jgi:hypothetical protein
MKSRVITLCKEWLATATPEQIEFVDQVYAMCEKHYSDGGDTIVECYTPQEILEEFKTLDDAKERCGMAIEQALNARWGEDTDPEVERARRYDEWKEGLA